MKVATPDGMNIVEMNEGHLAEIARIENICFSSPWSFDALRSELYNELAAFFTAELGGRPVGYAGMNYVLDEGCITNIAVLPEYRRRGVATALLGKLNDFAVKRKLATLSLEVRQSNLGAIRIYEREGYEKAGVRRNFYENPRENAYIMTKTVESETGVKF